MLYFAIFCLFRRSFQGKSQIGFASSYLILKWVLFISSKEERRMSLQPLLGIEIDGYAYHHKGTVQSSRDALKDHIFKSYHLQLLRLSTKGANEEEKVKEQLDTIC